jgi:endo-1,4-beta-xylanase
LYGTAIGCYFFIGLAAPLCAQEDAYHAGLRAMLQSQYGITGGRWLLGDSEETTLSHAVWSRVTTAQTASDQPSFTQTLHLTAAEKQPHSWDAYIRFPTTLPTQSGDALLLMVWINSGESVKSATHVFESEQEPFTESLYANAEIQPEWQLWILPFTAQSSGSAHYQLNLGGFSGSVQMSAPAILNFEKKYRTYELPVVSPSLAYEGHEQGAAWRTAALQRIEEIRKGDMQIQVVNSLGEAVEGAQVQLTMKQHDFGFGTAITISPWLQPSAEGNEYLAKLMNLDGHGHGFNVAVLENALKWPVWENESLYGSKEQVVQVVHWLREHEFRVRGHNLIWPNWTSMPADLKQNSDNLLYLENRIRDHFFEILQYPGLKGEIEDWDVLNEPLSCRDLETAFGSDSIYAQWFKWAHQADADTRLYMNENEILTQAGSDSLSFERFKGIIERLNAAGAPLHGIGVQGHMKYGLTPPSRLLEIFDELARYGKEISITEYDAVNINDELAADYMRDILIAVFSHPAARNFIMWGFWDGAHWQNDAPLFNRDWSLKPSGEVFMDYVFNR